MNRKTIGQLILVAIVALLLGGAFLIVSRSGQTGQSGSPAGYVH